METRETNAMTDTLTAEAYVMQTRFGDPDGNCLEACIASITGIGIEEVPHFLGDDWAYQYRKWLFNAGWHWQFFFVGEIPTPIGLVIANGESPRGLGHSVLYREVKLAHDPHPEGGGILSVDSWIIIEPTEMGIAKDAEFATLRTRVAELEAALREWKCRACGGRKTEICMCDGQSCRSGCRGGEPCRRCEGTGIAEQARRVLSGEPEAGR